jgi:hypothetical protein
MTSKIIVNTIEADTGISSVTFASNINLANDSSILVSSSGIRLGTGSTIAAPSANEITLSTNSAERFRIDSAGRMLLGTTTEGESNADTLTIAESGNAGMTIRSGSSATGSIYFSDATSGGGEYDGWIAYNQNSRYFQFGTAQTERLRIDSSGNVGIGTDTIQANTNYNTLEIVGDAGTTGGGIVRLKTGNLAAKTMLFCDTGGFEARVETNHPFVISTNNTERLRILSDGKVGINIANPERKLEVVDTAGSLTFPVAVSNHTDASAGVGAGIAFHLTAGGNARGDFGVVYAGNSNSDGTDFVFRPNDGSTGSVERLRIKGSSGATIISNAGTFPTSTNETLTIQGEGHNGHGTTNTRSVFNITAARNSNSNAAGLWIGARTNENTAVIGTRTASGNLAIETYNGGWGERLRITNAGYVLKSDTPAFKCKLSTATGANFTGVLVFGNVSYNIGSHYNSSNGRFTAPVDGRYLFCWYTNMERAGGNGSFYADWVINGNNQGNRMYTHHSGAWELIGGTVIFDLNANDYVQIKAITSGNWDGGSYGSYSGYLLG